MADAAGIARIISEMGDSNWNFGTGQGLAISIGSVTLSGTWSLTDDNSDTISWDGDDPSMTNTSSQTSDADFLDIRVISPAAGNRVAVIPHTPVSLSEGDTIIYTSIQITFTTDDFPG